MYNHRLARNYAKAFLNLFYPEAIPADLIDRFKSLQSFLAKQKMVSVLLSSSGISHSKMCLIVEKLANHLKLKENEKNFLIKVVSKQNPFLIKEISQAIIDLSMKKRREISCEITTSHEIDDNQKQQIVRFLSQKTNLSISAAFLVDSNLIAGIKAKSNHFVWEKSIVQRIEILKRKFLGGAT